MPTPASPPDPDDTPSDPASSSSDPDSTLPVLAADVREYIQVTPTETQHQTIYIS